MASHYDRLGVRPSASTEEIRAAYRALARRLHPDAAVGASPAERSLAERRMREINESWQVLQDPGRRRSYDEARQRAARVGTAPVGPRRPAAVPVQPADVPPSLEEVAVAGPGGLAAALYRHLPWLAIVMVLGAIFVGTAYAKRPDPAPPEPQGLQAGDCVRFEGATPREVACETQHDLVVVALAAGRGDCGPGTEWRRLEQTEVCIQRN